MTSIIDIRDLDVTFETKAILSKISLSLQSGDILGLLGPSGCGKTTLLHTIAGFIEQSSGFITIDKNDVITPTAILPPEARNVGMIFQDYALFPHLSVSQNVAFGLSHFTKEKKASRVNEVLTLLKLTDFEKRFPHQLSGGQQQRVAIGRALAPQPKILLLDEPFTNIDARLRHELMIEIRQLLKSLNMSAIFVTHNKDEVFTFADKVAVMAEGKILQCGTPVEVSSYPNNWQVADFLQLGGWVPVMHNNSEGKTALGNISLGKKLHLNTNEKRELLVRPNHLIHNPQGIENVEITHAGYTEQGFQYLVKSLHQDNELSFDNLHFYSENSYSLGDHICLHIKPHDYFIPEN